VSNTVDRFRNSRAKGCVALGLREQATYLREESVWEARHRQEEITSSSFSPHSIRAQHARRQDDDGCGSCLRVAAQSCDQLKTVDRQVCDDKVRIVNRMKRPLGIVDRDSSKTSFPEKCNVHFPRVVVPMDK
jgi:hypothetical protein